MFLPLVGETKLLASPVLLLIEADDLLFALRLQRSSADSAHIEALQRISVFSFPLTLLAACDALHSLCCWWLPSASQVGLQEPTGALLRGLACHTPSQTEYDAQVSSWRSYAPGSEPSTGAHCILHHQNQAPIWINRLAQIEGGVIPSFHVLTMSCLKWFVIQKLADIHDVHPVVSICQEWSHLGE